MPVYKGSTEITSGNLYKSSTKIENGYKQNSQFYVNTNPINILFVDSISGASLSTTTFNAVGTPGTSFNSFTRNITTDAGRIFSGTVTVSESNDPGNNVSASISGQGSTTATLNVSGTFPATPTTITLTISGNTQVQLPSLILSGSSASSSGPINANDSSSGTASYSWTGGCPNSSPSRTGSVAFPSSMPLGLSSGNILCPNTCTNTISVSASGYNGTSISTTIQPQGICTMQCVSISYSGGGTIASNSTWGCSGYTGVGNGTTANTTCTCAQNGQNLTSSGSTSGRLRIRPAPNSNPPTCVGGGGITTTTVFGAVAGNGQSEWLVDWVVNTPGGSGSISCTAN
jgi:hypothetical protein